MRILNTINYKSIIFMLYVFFYRLYKFRRYKEQIEGN